MNETPSEASWTEALRGISVDPQTTITAIVLNFNPEELKPEDRGKNIKFQGELSKAVGDEHSSEVYACLITTRALLRTMPSRPSFKEPTLKDVSDNLDRIKGLPVQTSLQVLSDTDFAILTLLCTPRG